MSLDAKDKLDRRSFLTLAGSGAAATVAGCMGDDTSDDSDGTEGSDGSGGDGGSGESELVYLAVDALAELDPGKASSTADMSAVVNMYDTVLTIQGEQNKLAANLGTDWSVENDGTTWVLNLRDDVTHHSGNQFTAEDVVYSLNRVLRLNSSPATPFKGIITEGSVSARDETTVEFNLEFPYAPFLSTLVRLFVVDSTKLQEDVNDGNISNYLNSNAAGSGPYTLTSATSGSELQLEAFGDYWGGWEDNQFDSARIRIVSEDSTAKILMQDGNADLTNKFLATETYNEMAGYDNVNVVNQPSLFLWHIPMNTTKPPLDDIKVREAITHAYNYQTVIDEIMQGGAVAVGPVPNGLEGHNDELEPYSQDLDAAQAALEESSYSLDEINQIEMEIMYTSVVPRERPISLLLQQNLKEIGIENVTISDTQFSQMIERASQKETTPHFTQVGNGVNQPTPDGFTYGMYHPSSFGQINACSFYSTDELASTLEEARITKDREERLNLYKDAQEMIHSGYPSVYIANIPYRAAQNANLEGPGYKRMGPFHHSWYSYSRSGNGRAK